ncbi:MAG: rhomboid family intramembrane serine protease [Kiritimatiellia bacterium]
MRPFGWLKYRFCKSALAWDARLLRVRERLEAWRERRGFFLLRIPPNARRLIALCSLVYLIQATLFAVSRAHHWGFTRTIEFTFGLFPDLLVKGFWWQPFSYALLHAGWWHLLLNMLGVALMGSAIEWRFGKRAFWLVFWLGALCSAAGVLIQQTILHGWGEGRLCIGASGGVSALFGALLAGIPVKHRITLLIGFVIPVRLPVRLAILVVLGLNLCEALFLADYVAWAAHLGGFLCGLLLGTLCRWREELEYLCRLD